MENKDNLKLLRIFLGESDRVGSNLLYEAIVFAAKEAKLSGCTVLRGIEGFGAHSIIHKTKFLELSSDLPVVVEIVDDENKINEFIPAVDALFDKSGSGGLITLENIEVIRYKPGAKRD